MKIFKRSLDYHFPLNSFKISWKSSDFPVEILNFLWRSGASPTEPTYPESTELTSFFLGADPRILGKKLKMQEENLGKIHQNSLASGGSAPTTWSDKSFNYSYIFVQLRAKNSCNFCYVIKFYITDFDKFDEIFSTFGGLRLPSPPLPHVHIRLFIFPIIKILSPALKFK